MRKLAWFLIIFFGVILTVAIICAVNDPFKQAVSSTLNGVGGGILAGLGTMVQNLANIVSVNVTYFTIYSLSVMVVGALFWFGVKKLWGRRPAILQKSPIQVTYQGQPNYQPPQQIATPPQTVQQPVATPVPPKVEEPKKEAAAA